MATYLGVYLTKLKSNKAKISRITGITTNRINTICNDANSIIYGDELYKIIYVANQLAGLNTEDFNSTIDEILPEYKRIDLLEQFPDPSPVALFFAKYTQKQNDIEKNLGMPKGKISKYFNDKSKRAYALEIINFSKGMEMDYLSVFKEIYGDISKILQE